MKCRLMLNRILSIILCATLVVSVSIWDCSSVNAADGSVSIDEAHFPDGGFREWILKNMDWNQDGVLSENELNQTSLVINQGVGERFNIKKLDGIECFSKLKTLACGYTYITELDLSPFPELEVLDCGGNDIDNINVGCAKKLRVLDCSETKISKLDVSNNPQLEGLRCEDTSIEYLNLKNNINLEGLYCSDSKIKELDISNNNKLLYLDVHNTEITKLDVSNNVELANLRCTDTNIDELDLRNNIELLSLSCDNTLIKALDLSQNVKLESLGCSNTQIKALDLSKNEWLVGLGCSNTKITNLDLSKNTKLRSLETFGCPIAYLDLSNNPKMGIGESEIVLESNIRVDSAESVVDLEKLFPGIDVSKIVKVYSDYREQPTLDGKMLTIPNDPSGIVHYTYDCGIPSAKGTYLTVTLHFPSAEKPTTPPTGDGGSWTPTEVVQNPIIVTDDYVEVKLSSDGKSVKLKVAEGYEVASIVLNGTLIGTGTNISGLKTGDVIEIKTRKKPTLVEQAKEQLSKVTSSNFKARTKQVTMKSGKTAVKVNWINTSGVVFDGVEIFRSTKKNSGYVKKYTSKSGKFYNTSVKAGKRYCYKVRGYIEIDGVKYYTAWSSKAWRTVK